MKYIQDKQTMENITTNDYQKEDIEESVFKLRETIEI